MSAQLPICPVAVYATAAGVCALRMRLEGYNLAGSFQIWPVRCAALLPACKSRVGLQCDRPEMFSASPAAHMSRCGLCSRRLVFARSGFVKLRQRTCFEVVVSASVRFCNCDLIGWPATPGGAGKGKVTFYKNLSYFYYYRWPGAGAGGPGFFYLVARDTLGGYLEHHKKHVLFIPT